MREKTRILCRTKSITDFRATKAQSVKALQCQILTLIYLKIFLVPTHGPGEYFYQVMLLASLKGIL